MDLTGAIVFHLALPIHPLSTSLSSSFIMSPRIILSRLLYKSLKVNRRRNSQRRSNPPEHPSSIEDKEKNHSTCSAEIRSTLSHSSLLRFLQGDLKEQDLRKPSARKQAAAKIVVYCPLLPYVGLVNVDGDTKIKAVCKLSGLLEVMGTNEFIVVKSQSPSSVETCEDPMSRDVKEAASYPRIPPHLRQTQRYLQRTCRCLVLLSYQKHRYAP